MTYTFSYAFMGHDNVPVASFALTEKNCLRVENVLSDESLWIQKWLAEGKNGCGLSVMFKT